jgi:hypothetical protein
MSAIGTHVYVVNIEHRYGNTMSVHATVEGATEFVYKWVVDYWTLSAGIPTDREKAIAEYFDLFTGESYSIYATVVEV